MRNRKKVFVGYIPVVHRGFLEFFISNEIDEVYVVSKEVIDFLVACGLDYLQRDVRAIEPRHVVSMIGSIHEKFSPVKLFRARQFNDHTEIDEDCDIYLAQDEVGRKLDEFYFSPKNKKVVFATTFLRWDKLISTQELEVAPDRIVSEKTIDRDFMKDAFSESEKSSDWWRHVGCVVLTKTGKKVFGHNHHMPHEHIPYIEGDVRSNFNPGERNDLGTAIHAEASVISSAAREGVALQGSTVYVTTFPCQNCARLIVNAGIKKVLYRDGYSVQDAERIFKDAGVEIVLVR